MGDGGPRYPRKADYPDAHEYAEVRDERLREYVDGRDAHERRNRDAFSTLVNKHETALDRSDENRGWVKTDIDGLKSGVKELQDSGKARLYREIALITMMAMLVITFTLSFLKGS